MLFAGHILQTASPICENPVLQDTTLQTASQLVLYIAFCPEPLV
jgi:hypothetical protein